MKEQVIHVVPRTSPLPEYYLNTNPMDYIVTPPVYHYRDTEDELSDQAVES